MQRICARLGLAAGLVLGAAMLTIPIAHADNCSSLQDCFYVTVDAAQVVAGVTVVVVALALFLPGLLRTARTPAEAEKTASTEGSDRERGPTATATPSTTSNPSSYSAQATQAAGHSAGQPGMTQPQPPALAQQPAFPSPSGAAPVYPGAATVSGSAVDLPNLPDTPDVPESPEAFETLLAAQVGTRVATDEAQEIEVAEAESHSAREYTPDALAQMQALNVSSARVEDVIRRGAASIGSRPGTTQYGAPGDDLLVEVDAITGAAVSVERRSV